MIVLAVCRIYIKCKIVYQTITNRGPNDLNNLFSIHDGNQSLCTSVSLYLDIPRTYIKLGDNNFAVSGGGKIWYCIPQTIKHDQSVESFKEII